MKKFIREYVAFNIWANDRVCKTIATITEEQFNLEMKSSFPTIRETFIHIWNTQDIWMQRLEGHSPTSWPQFSGSRDEAMNGLLKSSKALEKKATKYSKKKLREEIAYVTMKAGPGISPIYQIITHVVNHGTYHRGQLITMLRNAGIVELPATDLIAFFRETSKQIAKAAKA